MISSLSSQAASANKEIRLRNGVRKRIYEIVKGFKKI